MNEQSGLSIQRVSKRFGDCVAVADVSVDLPAGQQLVLLGPSGCGKTTLLRMVAGLEVPDAGVISIGGELVSEPGRAVPPERRRVGMVFQDWALFPHMSVARNVAYGLNRAQVRAGRAQQALELVHMDHLADRSPHELSAGQAQRVALARAIAPQPRLLLFDEPFSSLDAELRVSLRSEVAALMRDVQMTAVFVTHDQEEAFVLGDQVAVMNEGRVIQVGTPAQIYSEPATGWVASFVGEANLLAAEVNGRVATTVLGDLPLRSGDVGPRVVLARPEHISLTKAGPGSPGTVTAIEFYGHDTSYRVEVAETPVVVRVPAGPAHRVGDQVAVTYNGPDAVTFAATTGLTGTP
ncbi:MAG: ABC transporter ATP-binding protein [Candidatus Nanopelagicales bacterium]